MLIVTGTFQAWRQVRSLDVLRNTDYGQLLIIKLAIVAVILAFAARSRQLRAGRGRPSRPTNAGASWSWRAAPTMTPAPTTTLAAGGEGASPEEAEKNDAEEAEEDWEIDEALELRRLRGSVFVEVLGAIAVIVVTALLVNAEGSGEDRPQPGGVRCGGGHPEVAQGVEIATVPGRVGVNACGYVSALTPQGAPLKVA